MNQTNEAEALFQAGAEIDRLRALNRDLLAALKNYLRLHDMDAALRSGVNLGCTCGTCKAARAYNDAAVQGEDA